MWEVLGTHTVGTFHLLTHIFHSHLWVKGHPSPIYKSLNIQPTEYYQGPQSRTLTDTIFLFISSTSPTVRFFSVCFYLLTWLLWWCSLRITMKPYMCQISKLIFFQTLTNGFIFPPAAATSSATCWFSLNGTRSFYCNCSFSLPTLFFFFPVASRHCSPAFTGFISAVLRYPTERPCSDCCCISAVFLRDLRGVFCLFVSGRQHWLSVNDYPQVAF